MADFSRHRDGAAVSNKGLSPQVSFEVMHLAYMIALPGSSNLSALTLCRNAGFASKRTRFDLPTPYL
jgi:hypothetical protein